MMQYFKYIITCLFLSTLLACSMNNTTNKVDMSIYEFDELESVKSIPNWSQRGWSDIDEYSLIVQSSPSKYYLLILALSNSDLRYVEDISISSTGSRVRAGFDSVSIPSIQGVDSPIETIYVLSGREQANEITHKIQQAE